MADILIMEDEENVIRVEDVERYVWTNPYYRLQTRKFDCHRRKNTSIMCYVDTGLRAVGTMSRKLMDANFINIDVDVANNVDNCFQGKFGDNFIYFLIVADKNNRHHQTPENLERCFLSLRDMCANQSITYLDVPVNTDIPYEQFKDIVNRSFVDTDVILTLTFIRE